MAAIYFYGRNEIEYVLHHIYKKQIYARRASIITYSAILIDDGSGAKSDQQDRICLTKL
jgi:hypothetical protein